MAVKHVNRKGDAYYLHHGRTKTGKTRYFFSRDQSGDLTKSIPAGFEIYENPNAQVFLRKATPQLIRDEEVESVKAVIAASARVKHYQVEAKKNTITVFLADQNPDELFRLLGHDLLLLDPGKAEAALTRAVHYSPVLRFVLVSESPRLFNADRWCWRGSIDGWLNLAWSKKLGTLAKKFCPHLGQESFYDLI